MMLEDEEKKVEETGEEESKKEEQEEPVVQNMTLIQAKLQQLEQKRLCIEFSFKGGSKLFYYT